MRHFLHSVRVVGVAVLLGVLGLAGLGTPLFAQDVFKRATTPYVQFPAVPWGGGAGAFNNTFWFNTLEPEQGVCIYITNNSQLNNHTFGTLNVSVTANPNVPGFTGFTQQWVGVPNTNVTLPITILLGNTKAFFFPSRGAAFVAVTFNGSVALGGNNDTATIIMVLENSTSCSDSTATGISQVIGPTPAGSAISGSNNQPVVIGGKQQVTGVENATAMFADIDSNTRGLIVGNADTPFWNNYNGSVWTPVEISTGNNVSGHSLMPILDLGAGNDVSTPAANPIQTVKNYGLAVSDGWAWTSGTSGCAANCGALFYANDTVNPAAGFLLASVTQTGTTGSITPARVTIGCSANCDVFINKINSNGNTCTAAASVKAFDNSQGGTAQNNTVQTGACVANPAVQSQVKHVYLLANTTLVVDLTGYWTQGTAAEGFDVVNGAAIAAGNVSITFEWNERGHPL